MRATANSRLIVRDSLRSMRRKLQLAGDTPSTPWWFGLAAWALGWAGLLLLDAQIDLANKALLLVLTAAVAAIGSRPWISMAAAAAAVLAFNVVFVPPRGSFTVDLHQHALLLTTMLAVSWIVTLLVARLRWHAAQSDSACAALGSDTTVGRGTARPPMGWPRRPRRCRTPCRAWQQARARRLCCCRPAARQAAGFRRIHDARRRGRRRRIRRPASVPARWPTHGARHRSACRAAGVVPAAARQRSARHGAALVRLTSLDARPQGLRRTRAGPVRPDGCRRWSALQRCVWPRRHVSRRRRRRCATRCWQPSRMTTARRWPRILSAATRCMIRRSGCRPCSGSGSRPPSSMKLRSCRA